MIRCLHRVFLVGASLLFSPLILRASTPEQVKADEQALGEASLRTDGASLLQFLKARTPGDRTLENIEELIRKLGSESFRVRQRASEELIRIGPPALTLLRGALESKDLEVSRRARDCLSSIERTEKAGLIAAAVRLLADRRPAGAVQAFLDYLPYVEDAYLADELHAALIVAGIRQGKADEALSKALDGKNPIRRAAAAEAFVRAGSDEDRKAMRKLLKDADVRVRTRVALAFVDRKEREAVVVLIDVLPEASRDQFWRIEQILTALGGDDGPKVLPGTTAVEMREYRTAWRKWWSEKGGAVNMAVLDDAQRQQGLTLIVSLDPRNPAVGGRVAFQGRVGEVGRDGKLRWEIANLNYPIDAQIVGRDHVLITEYRGRQVTERNFKGEVLWQHQATGFVIAAQRLDSGNTLIVTRTDVVEVNKTGQEVFRFNSPASTVSGARRLKNGETVVMERTGICQRVNAKGESVKQITLGAVLAVIGTQFDVLPNGNVLLPLYSQNKVVEYNPEGQQVWQHTCERPTAVSRLPNGNTLIASRYSKTVLEIDRAGKKVWEFESPNGTVIGARRR